MKIFLVAILSVLVLSTEALCGDYTLTISDDIDAPCTERARKAQDWCQEEIAKGRECRIDISWPIHTTDEVVESLDLYFTDKEPRITILLPAFSNGHLAFCSQEERCKVYEHLQRMKATGNVRNTRHLEDFIKIMNVKEDECLHNKAL